MSLFRPLVVGKALENCGRVFWGAKHPQKLLEFFKISVLKSTHFGQRDQNNQNFQQSFRCNLVNYKDTPTFA